MPKSIPAALHEPSGISVPGSCRPEGVDEFLRISEGEDRSGFLVKWCDPRVQGLIDRNDSPTAGLCEPAIQNDKAFRQIDHFPAHAKKKFFSPDSGERSEGYERNTPTFRKPEGIQNSACENERNIPNDRT